MGRSPVTALIMGLIPVVNLYLLYKWWGEINEAGGKKHDPIIYTILFLIPFANIYALYELLSTVDELGKRKAKEGYALGALPLLVVSLILVVPVLYVLYRTQEILNEC